jgi:hypothetical protein
MLNMSDMGFACCSLYLNADVSQLTITIGKELLTMQLITNLLVILRMGELALVEYFVMGEAIGIVATLFVSFYFSKTKCKSFQLI